MVRLLSYTGRAGLDTDDGPKEIVKTPSATGDNGWLIRFFDSAFFCEWIAVSYLYKYEHSGVRDYLCNRMYSLPLSGIESYLFQLCYMVLHMPSPSLEKYIVDMCAKSLRIATKVHWFLMAEAEDTVDSESILKVQERCQMAALEGDWPTLIRPQKIASSPGAKSRVFKAILSSRRLLPLTSTTPPQRTPPPVPLPTMADEGFREANRPPVDETESSLKVLKKFIPTTKVRDAFMKKFREKEEKEEKEEEEFASERAIKETDSESFFKRLFRDKDEDEKGVRSDELVTSEGFFRRFFRDKPDAEEKAAGNEDEKDGFFRKLFREKNEEEEKGSGNWEDGEGPEFFLFRRLFRQVHPEEDIVAGALSELEHPVVINPETSPGNDNFFKRLFLNRTVEDGGKFFSVRREGDPKRPGSPKRRTVKADKSSEKPPLPKYSLFHIRKGVFHATLDFVQSLCETSSGLADIFPMEDRHQALRESLVELNHHLVAAENDGGVCFPMGRGLYRVVHIPEDDFVLLNSREKAPYLICVEVLKCEANRFAKDSGTGVKLARRGIPLASGDAQLQRPPPWAYPLQPDIQQPNTQQLLRTASKAIDLAMAHLWETKLKVVDVSFSVQLRKQETFGVDIAQPECRVGTGNELPQVSLGRSCHAANREPAGEQMEWVSVTLSVVPGVKMEDVEEEQPARRKEHRRVPSKIAMDEVKAAVAEGEAPPGLPMKKSGTAPSQERVGVNMKATDALAGELWENKKERIRRTSKWSSNSDWDLRSMIVKSGDDCRQEHLAVQLVAHFYDIYQEAGLPLWLRPYEVLVTSSHTALIETIYDTASIHAIKSRNSNLASLRDFFCKKYDEGSPSFKLAQRNFVESMAGYSILCYFLQVKDRHNANLLLDEDGHIIHIDFGFMLSNSPGGVNFESAPFKLTRELLEVMDSDAEGTASEFFDYFKVLCIQGFLTCRKHAERIILLVEMMQDSGCPCFKGGPRTMQNLRKRFHLSLTEEQCVSLVLSLISSSLDAWRTRQYDYYQRVLNGIL
ncbi:unnamed protein product [Sphagnum jensenii]|uniref:1-phosphatidylinositol 4-kinase n=1 Tax=Sphagnum jensenii TaxID=128206 RepID=A0ABP0VP55_9BRYO